MSTLLCVRTYILDPVGCLGMSGVATIYAIHQYQDFIFRHLQVVPSRTGALEIAGLADDWYSSLPHPTRG